MRAGGRVGNEVTITGEMSSSRALVSCRATVLARGEHGIGGGSARASVGAGGGVSQPDMGSGSGSGGDSPFSSASPTLLFGRTGGAVIDLSTQRKSEERARASRRDGDSPSRPEDR